MLRDAKGLLLRRLGMLLLLAVVLERLGARGGWVVWLLRWLVLLLRVDCLRLVWLGGWLLLLLWGAVWGCCGMLARMVSTGSKVLVTLWTCSLSVSRKRSWPATDQQARTR